MDRSKTDRKPSQIIEEFVKLLQNAKDGYEEARKHCEEMDSMERHKNWGHRFEFAKDKAERNRLATEYQRERKERRAYKDVADLYKTINDFARSENNKPALSRLNGMLRVQRAQEKYLDGERHYNEKAGD